MLVGAVTLGVLVCCRAVYRIKTYRAVRWIRLQQHVRACVFQLWSTSNV